MEIRIKEVRILIMLYFVLLEKAVNHVKKSLAKYKESSKQKVTFSLDKSNSQDAFSTPIKLTDENGEDETKNKYSILKSLKV